MSSSSRELMKVERGMLVSNQSMCEMGDSGVRWKPTVWGVFFVFSDDKNAVKKVIDKLKALQVQHSLGRLHPLTTRHVLKDVATLARVGICSKIVEPVLDPGECLRLLLEVQESHYASLQ
ncbi:hypothetical protein F7U66_01355 [Vibrio parahaemolyticus]|nr:hypothetical protein [Vibrio parahaemolyticus]